MFLMHYSHLLIYTCLDVKNVVAVLPILIVVIGSIILAIYMLVVSIARKVLLIDRSLITLLEMCYNSSRI